MLVLVKSLACTLLKRDFSENTFLQIQKICRNRRGFKTTLKKIVGTLLYGRNIIILPSLWELKNQMITV